jgi:hypothetical protein
MPNNSQDELQACNERAVQQAEFAARMSAKRTATFGFNAATNVYNDSMPGRDYFGRTTVENQNIRGRARGRSLAMATRQIDTVIVGGGQAGQARLEAAHRDTNGERVDETNWSRTKEFGWRLILKIRS